MPKRGPWVRGTKAASFPMMYPGVVCPASRTPRLTASWISKGGTTAPAGDTSILSRPPEVFSIVATSSFAASSGNTPSGQAVCIFHRIGAWAVAGAGAPYEPARKASNPTMRAMAIAVRVEIILRIELLLWIAGMCSTPGTKLAESRQRVRTCQWFRADAGFAGLLDHAAIG